MEGKGIGLTARNLNIITPQDSERYRGKQFHGNVQITVGYGFSGNAEYSQSKTDADHLSASEQSGLYAGDDGFQVAVSRHTELNGGLIVSSRSAEQNGRNRFQTGSLGQSDLANHSRYSGKSFGFGMSGGINGKQTLQLMKSTFRSSHGKSAVTEVRTNLLRMWRHKDPAVIYRIIRAPSGRNWKRNMAGET
ncbi:hypothetical protein HMPREF1177_01341 [Eikenella corrodens CC92I]|uniref:Uncharacterized protein n=1 Tax=Eikenella corrodens CC92I TaxID=1073362 RepID=V7IB35_EIKCO|nr:hypothetical protein HMPREF1177_02119 [Eikenella corrodens CC92I]ETA83425.1 hypothetical protein HMPREF1177_01341 [Eikenella corrodens CC92I]